MFHRANCSPDMSGARSPDVLAPWELGEWFEALGLPVEGTQERSLREQLTDGVLLCQLVNKIKPGCVETVSPAKGNFGELHVG